MRDVADSKDKYAKEMELNKQLQSDLKGKEQELEETKQSHLQIKS